MFPMQAKRLSSLDAGSQQRERQIRASMVYVERAKEYQCLCRGDGVLVHELKQFQLCISKES